MANLGPTQSFQYFTSSVFNGRFPPEGPKVVPAILAFNTQQTFNIDLTLAYQAKQISLVQSIMFDNSNNTLPIVLTVSKTGQVLKLPGGAQGTVPVFCPDPPIFVATCLGANQATIFFCNMPLPACVWPATGEPIFNAAGAMIVSDATLDAAIISNQVQVTPALTENNNVIKPQFGADELFTGSVTALGNTVVTTGAPSYFITDATVYVTPDASLAAAGELTVQLRDNATVIATGIAFLPNAQPASPLEGPVNIIELRNIQFNSKANTVPLNLNLSAALTSGHVYYNIAGGLCSNIGP